MKIAITCQNENTDSPVDSRFGRAPLFFLIDSDEKPGYYIQNKQNLQAAQGAGIQAAQNVLAEDPEVLITGHCGPKAYKILKEAGVRIFQTERDKTVEEALRLFADNKLKELDGADVEGHWV